MKENAQQENIWQQQSENKYCLADYWRAERMLKFQSNIDGLEDPDKNLTNWQGDGL